MFLISLGGAEPRCSSSRLRPKKHFLGHGAAWGGWGDVPELEVIRGTRNRIKKNGNAIQNCTHCSWKSLMWVISVNSLLDYAQTRLSLRLTRKKPKPVARSDPCVSLWVIPIVSHSTGKLWGNFSWGALSVWEDIARPSLYRSNLFSNSYRNPWPLAKHKC